MRLPNQPLTLRGANRPRKARLLEIINRLVDAGNTVIVTEHNPEGGTKGGKVMFEGTPKQLLTAKNSLTREYIRN